MIYKNPDRQQIRKFIERYFVPYFVCNELAHYPTSLALTFLVELFQADPSREEQVVQ